MNQQNQFKLLNSEDNAQLVTNIPSNGVNIISTSTIGSPTTYSNIVSISNTGSATSPLESMITGSINEQYCMNTIPNSYWDGVFCRCKAGYTNTSGTCRAIILQQSTLSQNTV